MDRLLLEIGAFCSEGPHLFPDDALNRSAGSRNHRGNHREKLLRNLRDEVPHGVAVMVEQMKERADKGLVDLFVTIVCERESHKRMIIGKGGAA